MPIAFGWLTKRGDAATARWIKPVLTRPEIRRDAVLQKSGFKIIGTEISFAPGRKSEIEETILRKD